VMRLIADEREGIAVVLEDDIDMEHDIRERLGSVWGRLPDEWDIVFLGAILGQLRFGEMFRR
jgi:GR25 family glycosyltransferase involved in LPS biosynthesis